MKNNINTAEVKTLSGVFKVDHFKDNKGTIWYSADDILRMLGYSGPGKRIDALYVKGSAIGRVQPCHIVEFDHQNVRHKKVKRFYWNTHSFAYLQGLLKGVKLSRYHLITDVVKQVGTYYKTTTSVVENTVGDLENIVDNVRKCLNLDKFSTLNRDLSEQKQYSKFLSELLADYTSGDQEDLSLVETPHYPKGFTEVSWDLYLVGRYKHKHTNAKSRNIPFHLTFTEFKELFSYHHCYYTGKEMIFTFAEGGNPPSRYATVERVDNKGNYDKNNTVLCCKAVNDFKSLFENGETPFTLKDIVNMADKMKDHMDFS